MDPIEKIINQILSVPLYKGIFFIISSIIIAKISDIIFTSLLKRMAGKTQAKIAVNKIDRTIKIHSKGMPDQ